ncbi:MAG TPA: thermonuclease family protein [Actinomycetes bacterium]|nr:thermonuclease family protein [Actinomycetes bacterium]
MAGRTSRGVFGLLAVFCALLVLAGGSSQLADVSRRANRAAELLRSPNPRSLQAVEGAVSKGWTVTRVVDGDTVDLSRDKRHLIVRMIGIDTPETVDPNIGVECFGQDASEFASKVLLHQRVALEYDASQGRLDRYGRTLAYVWVTASDPPWQYNARAVRLGYANEFTYRTPYHWQSEFLRRQQVARKLGLGLWTSCYRDPTGL